MTRAAKGKIYVITETIAGKFVDITSRENAYAIVWDEISDEYIHSPVLTTASVTYETLNSNGDVGINAGQLAIGNHVHTTAEISDTLDKRYVTDEQLSTIDAAGTSGAVGYKITLPSGGDVQERINAAVESTQGTNDGDYPYGWVLSTSGPLLDLTITHNLNRTISNVTVFKFTSTTDQQLRSGSAGYTSIYDYDGDAIKVQSLANVATRISINLIFNQE